MRDIAPGTNIFDGPAAFAKVRCGCADVLSNVAADELLLLLHGHDLLCLLPDAGGSGLPRKSHVCKAHLQVRKPF